MRKWKSVEDGLPDNTRDVWIWPHAGKAHYRVDTGTGYYMVSWHTWWSGYVVTHWAEIDWPETPEEARMMENEKMSVVLALKAEHADTWRDKPESYWLSRLMEEVGELSSALNGRHEHEPGLELMQIATLCLNWLDMRGDLTTARVLGIEEATDGA